jgi:phosphonate transport system permease protein
VACWECWRWWASFWSLDLQWASLSSPALARWAGFWRTAAARNRHGVSCKLLWATLETLAMSALGTLLAVALGLVLALPASKAHARPGALARAGTRLLLNALRSIPELVWATLLLIAAGWGRLPARWRWACTPRACWAACLPRH